MLDGLANLLNAASDLMAPLLRFCIWIFPMKVYRLHDGQRGVVLTFGKVRRKSAERGPGMTVCGPCEELRVIQAKGGYIDTAEQVLTTKEGRVIIGNGAIEYSVHCVRQAELELQNRDSWLAGVFMDIVRRWALKQTWEQIQDDERAAEALAGRVNRRISGSGCRIEQVFLTDLRPHNVQMACDQVESVMDRLFTENPHGETNQ